MNDEATKQFWEHVLAEIDDDGFFQRIEREARKHARYPPRNSCSRAVWPGTELPHIDASSLRPEQSYQLERKASDRLECWLEIGALLATLLLPLIVFLLFLFAPRIPV